LRGTHAPRPHQFRKIQLNTLDLADPYATSFTELTNHAETLITKQSFPSETLEGLRHELEHQLGVHHDCMVFNRFYESFCAIPLDGSGENRRYLVVDPHVREVGIMTMEHLMKYICYDVTTESHMKLLCVRARDMRCHHDATGSFGREEGFVF